MIFRFDAYLFHLFKTSKICTLYRTEGEIDADRKTMDEAKSDLYPVLIINTHPFRCASAKRRRKKKIDMDGLQAPQVLSKIYIGRHKITNDEPDHPGSSSRPKVLQTNTTDMFKG